MKGLLQGFSRRWLLRCAVVLGLVGISLCLGAARRTLADRVDQQAAARWSADGTPFAQLSLYFAQPQTLQSINETATRLDNALTEASLEAVSEDARLWLSAYSNQQTATATTPNGTATVQVLAVGGDYFHFHPQWMLSGCTFAPDDEQKDTIVLDELAAWQLFGSSDVVGRTVTVNGALYTVCGVVAMADDDAAILTYGENPRVWVNYDRLYKLEDAGVLWYEVVLPNPYTGYAKGLMRDTFMTESIDCALVENSLRYSLGGLWGALRGIPRAALHNMGVAYPWWENAALYNQTRAGLLFGAQALCMVYPIGVLVALAVLGFKRRPWHFRDLLAAIDRRRQRKLAAAWDAAAHPDALSDFERMTSDEDEEM